MARELMHRWGKGWLTLLVLGAAYGIAEEGLICKSFFDPNWEDLGILREYGRWVGVNWVWSLLLTFYHAVFSITIPTLLVTLMFPEYSSREWLSLRILKMFFLLWIVNSIFIFLFISPYRPPFIPYLMAVILTISLGILARYISHPVFPPVRIRIAHPFWFGLTGFLATFSLFFLAWGASNIGISPLLTGLFIVGIAMMIVWVVLKMSGNCIVQPKYQFALASGALSFFILLALLQELDKARPDNTTGMSFVGLATIAFLFWIAWRIKDTFISAD